MANKMIQVRVYDKTNKRTSWKDTESHRSEITSDTIKCTPTEHYFTLGEFKCICGEYDGKDKPEEIKEMKAIPISNRKK